MQATVFSYDPATTTGTVVRDDGVQIAFEARALDDTGLRHLRAGQRVQLTLSGTDASPHIDRLQILTLG